MYEVVTGIPAFSNFYHDNLNLKRYDPLLSSFYQCNDVIVHVFLV